MSEDDYSGDEFDYGWEHDYCYIDDSYDIADELAERTCPSPPPYTEEELYEYDPFDYYHEVEDGTAGYFDVGGRKERVAPRVGQKRKKGVHLSKPNKRRVTEGGKGIVARNRSISPTPTVFWCSQDKRQQLALSTVKIFTQGSSQPYALLKDWRSELKEDTGLEKAKARAITLENASKDNGEGANVDVNAIMMALQNHLSSADSAIKGIDKSLLLQYALRMLENEDADGLLEELTENLLGGRPADGTPDEGDEMESLGESELEIERIASESDSPNEKTTTRNNLDPHIPKADRPDPSLDRERDQDQDRDRALTGVRASRKRKAEAEADHSDDICIASDSKRRVTSYAASTTTSRAKAASRSQGRTRSSARN